MQDHSLIPPQHVRQLDVLPHPHIGLSTVSYLFGGTVTHRDSLGIQQTIKPGEVNWMTAGPPQWERDIIIPPGMAFFMLI
jgi:redox-sensitive bicupin YhaK (pirin superfamily)